MRLDFVIMCEQVIIDAQTNRLSCINLFDGLQVPVFPTAISGLTFIISLSRTADEPETLVGTGSFFIDDDPIFDGPLDANFSGGLRTRVITQIQAFPIPKPGAIKGVFRFGAMEGSWTFPVEAAGGVRFQAVNQPTG